MTFSVKWNPRISCTRSRFMLKRVFRLSSGGGGWFDGRKRRLENNGLFVFFSGSNNTVVLGFTILRAIKRA